MQLVQCHIENFGKLHDFNYTFTDGLNSLPAANGWGKSTLATFIKAMFYGLPVTTKKDLDENERKKYQPWQGGNYGGNLVFSVHGKQYKIERFFGKKQAEDSFNLLEVSTGKKSHAFTENLGVELFGLDVAAFERSSYIPQKTLDSNFNESLAQKLNHVLQGASEDENLENALARLDKKRVTLSNNKKTGQIQVLATQLDAVATRMHELAGGSQAINDLQRQIAIQDEKCRVLREQQTQIRQQIKDYAKWQEKQANQALYAELNRKVMATQTALKNRQAVLRGHQTSVTEIDSYIALEKTVTAKANALQMNQGDYVRARKQALETYFKGKVPTAEKVKSIYDDVLQYNALRAQTDNWVVRKTQKRGQARGWRLGLLALALVAVLSGVALWTVQLGVAVALVVAGAGACLGALYLSLVNMINTKTALQPSIDYERLKENQTLMLKLQQSISEFLSPYESTNDYLTAINHVHNNWREYENLQAQSVWQAQQAGAWSATIMADQTKLQNYLAQFQLDTTNTASEQLATLKQVVIDLANLQTQLTEDQRALEQFKTAKNFDLNEAVVTVDINELQRTENDLQTQIDAYNADKAQLIAKIDKIQNEMSELDDCEARKINLQTEKQTLEASLAAVQSAMQFLQMANESLATKFLAPMKAGVKKYLQLLTDQNFDNLNLDTDFKIKFEEYGKLRAVEHYSRGYQNAIDLSMRFALIDALYQQEKPFIVLDDPFINLDEAKVAKAKSFLQILAKDYQLIYFTCHASRC